MTINRLAYVPIYTIADTQPPDAAILDECDVIFFATPHGVAMEGAGAFIEKGIKPTFILFII
jgi:N-acetyl-gamma-glutamylphosphate reductase